MPDNQGNIASPSGLGGADSRASEAVTAVAPKLGIFKCTVYEDSRYGDPRPVFVEGREVSAEIVAATAAKARYRYWRNVSEFWDTVKLQDIRVRSLNRQKAPAMPEGWAARLERCNAIIRVIASHGRHFLSENSDRRGVLIENPFIAYFKLDPQGELWYVDRYSRKPILVRHQEWPGFSDGGTLRIIIQRLAAHIVEDAPINPGYFGVSPEWMPDHWGYGDDMPKVAAEASRIIEREDSEALSLAPTESPKLHGDLQVNPGKGGV